MRKVLSAVLVVCGMIGLVCAGVAMGNGALPDGEPAIMVSPAVIVLAKVSTVTVHTNVPADLDDLSTVYLNEASPVGVCADDCGDLVARFLVADLDLSAGQAALTLSCSYEDGSGFSATDVVRVK